MTKHIVPKRNPRVEVRGKATVFFGAGALSCRTLNLSTSGLAVACPADGIPGVFVRVEFVLCQSLGNICLEAEVARVEKRGRGYLWGLEFGQLDFWVREYLESFVEERMVASAMDWST